MFPFLQIDDKGSTRWVAKPSILPCGEENNLAENWYAEMF